MQIHLSPRHIPLNAALHRHVAGVVGELENLADIIAAHVVLVHDDAAKPEDRFYAKVHLALPGSDVFAAQSAENIHLALDAAGDKLARQLRKRKTSVIDKRRQIVARANKRARGG